MRYFWSSSKKLAYPQGKAGDLTDAVWHSVGPSPTSDKAEGAIMLQPKDLVDSLEQGTELPSGNEERFTGYGVLGVPFTSGDLLAMRRFPLLRSERATPPCGTATRKDDGLSIQV